MVNRRNQIGRCLSFVQTIFHFFQLTRIRFARSGENRICVPVHVLFAIQKALTTLMAPLGPAKHGSSTHRVGLGSEGLYSFLGEADGTRSTQDTRRPGTKSGGGSQNRLTMQCAQWNASRAAAWRRRRVAVARPVGIDFVRNFVFSRVSKNNRKSAKCRNTVL